MYAYTQYLYGVAIIATIDLDTPDAFLVDPDSPQRSKWLLKNCEIVRLSGGDTYYEKVDPVRVPNEFSLFAETVKRRRTGNGEHISDAGATAPEAADKKLEICTHVRRVAASLVPEDPVEGEEDPFGFGFGMD